MALKFRIQTYYVCIRNFSAIYFGREDPPSIRRCGMDGSSPLRLPMSLSSHAYAIVIDFETSRFYWTEGTGHKMASSDLHGRDVHTVLEFPRAIPTGLAVTKGRLYWTEIWDYTLRSIMKNGQNMQIHFSVSNRSDMIAVP